MWCLCSTYIYYCIKLKFAASILEFLQGFLLNLLHMHMKPEYITVSIIKVYWILRKNCMNYAYQENCKCMHINCFSNLFQHCSCKFVHQNYIADDMFPIKNCNNLSLHQAPLSTYFYDTFIVLIKWFDVTYQCWLQNWNIF